MIITRYLLRISLGGGGTDLPSYFEEHSGFLVAAAIDKYVYITLHRTSSILKEQKTKTLESDKAMVENLHFIKDLGKQSQKALESGDLRGFGRLMDVHWQRKKERSAGMSNSQINEWYDHAMANGALGGKLIGAGGGGFLMFYAEDKTKLRHAMREKGLSEVRFRFDFEGTKIVIQS